MIDKAVIEEVRSRVDILEIIQSRIEVRRSGGAWKALCPFHTEKTPSFSIVPERQIYHCFGCGAGGDVFRFLMEFDRVDFPTAVRMLAERCGVRVEETAEERGPTGPPKDKLYATLQAAAQYYRRSLAEGPEAEAARVYLAARRLEGDAAEHFQIGYAPKTRGALRRWARDRKLSESLLEHAGLLSRSDRDGAVYERFRDRLMFPIRDELGRTVGFSGRIMDPAAKAAKYINSPETAVFRKSRVFFGLDAARPTLMKERRAIICEGQIDAIRCHEAGLRDVIASQGTAMTPDHARLMRRFADSVVFVLDADRAGQDAAIKSARLFLAADLDVLIAALPDGEDPDSLILERGPEAFRAIVDRAQSVVAFQIDVLEQREDPASDVGRQRIVRGVLETIAGVSQAVQRERMIQQLARRYLIADHLLMEDLGRIRAPAPRVAAPEGGRGPAKPYPPAELRLLELISRHEPAAALVRRYLPITCLADEDCRAVAAEILGTGDAEFDPAEASRQRLRAQVALAPPMVAGTEDAVLQATQDIILRLRRKGLEAKRAALRRQAMDAVGERQEALTAECHQLSLDIHLLKQGWVDALDYLDLDP